MRLSTLLAAQFKARERCAELNRKLFELNPRASDAYYEHLRITRKLDRSRRLLRTLDKQLAGRVVRLENHASEAQR